MKCVVLFLLALVTLSGVVWVFRKLLSYVYWEGSTQLDDSQDYGKSPTNMEG